MKRKIYYGVFVFTVLTITAAAGFAQGSEKELADLRGQLGVDANYKLAIAPTDTAPAGDPLKVFLALGLDMTAQSNIQREISKWNADKGKKFGRLEIVDDLAAADVIIARYRQTDQLSTATNTRSSVVPGMVWDPGQNKMVTAPVSRVSSSSTAIVPSFGYILTKRPEGAAIIYRYTTAVAMDEDKKSGTWLSDTLFVMLKNRKK